MTPNIYSPRENQVQQLYFNSKNQHKHARILDGQPIIYHVSWLKAGYYNWRMVCFAHLNVLVLFLQDFQRKHPPIFFPPVSFHGNLQGLTEEQRRLLRLSVGKPAATTETTPLAPVYGISEAVLAPSKCWKLKLGEKLKFGLMKLFSSHETYIYIYIYLCIYIHTYDQNFYSPFSLKRPNLWHGMLLLSDGKNQDATRAFHL